jgi:cyclopropane fatty-acyl-phospholipid synthase-like methyltransferase
MSEGYVHGYQSRENERLQDQAETLADLLHGDTAYPPGSEVLEAGCGVGAQSVILGRRSPAARITSMDISSASIAAAKRRVEAAGLSNVEFVRGDILDPPSTVAPSTTSLSALSSSISRSPCGLCLFLRTCSNPAGR